MAIRNGDGNDEDDTANALNRMATEHTAKVHYLPEGPRPARIGPDHDFRWQQGPFPTHDAEIGDAFVDHYKDLFTNGDGNIYGYHEKTGLWTSEDINDMMAALCHRMSNPHVEELVALTARAAAGEDVGTRLASLSGHIKRLKQFKTINAVTKYALEQLRGHELLGIKHPMNPDPELLSVPDGVVNLRTGRLRWRQPKDYLTGVAKAQFKPLADTARWRAIVLQICKGSEALAQWFQVMFGYCTTGHTAEQMMPIMWGLGSNGKNILVDAVVRALGDYATVLPHGALETGSRAGGMDNNEAFAAARLEGKRLAVTSETGDKGVLKESWVKAHTGDEFLTARLPREKFHTFRVTHKLLLLTNHKPIIRGTDEGMWRRMRLVQMPATFGSAERVAQGNADYVADVTLRRQLNDVGMQEEVLAWLVEGARLYLTNGLARYTPPEIAASTAMYRRESDTLGQFLSEVSEYITPTDIERAAEFDRSRAKNVTNAQKLQVSKLTLYHVYQAWAKDNGHAHTMSHQAFANRVLQTHRMWLDEVGEELTMQPLVSVRKMSGTRTATYFYRHIRLTDVGLRYAMAAERGHTGFGGELEEGYTDGLD